MEHSFEAMLVEHCAPTLAGIKPASLFRFQAESLDLIRHSVQVWDQCFEPKGIRVQVLMECPGSSVGIIYVYREKWVMHLLAEESRSTFLEQMGYRTGSAGEMLAQLSRRLCLEAEYPHEIGIFLGYPLQDVIGFIQNKARNFTCCGYWKCYGDPVAAQKCFERYRICTQIYKKRYAQGTPVVHLATAA